MLVASNFAENIRGRNVFVFFYSPNCGHCKKATPQVEKISKFINRDDVIIAKYDITQNDIPHANLELKGIPQFYLFKVDHYEDPIL